MKFKQVAMLAAALLFAATAYSGDKSHHKIEIKVATDKGNGERVVSLDSDALDFDMHEMQVGENRSVVDKNGTPVLITRTEKGFTLDVEGETIELPSFDRHPAELAHVKAARHFKIDHGSDVDVRVEAMESEGVLIFSGKEIDEATQQIIRSALESAGHSNVRFAGGDDDGPHQVRVIKEIHEVHEVSE